MSGERYPTPGEARALSDADRARQLIASRAYRDPADPMHGAAHAEVRGIFLRVYGSEPHRDRVAGPGEAPAGGFSR
jgi:hypothetical protein